MNLIPVHVKAVSKSFVFHLVSIFLLALSSSITVQAAASYTITDLGTLSGGTTSAAFDINNNTQVVGVSRISGVGSDWHAFLYENGKMIDLGTLGGTDSWARSINVSGQIVGESKIGGDTALRAFLYENGIMIDLGTLGGMRSHARSINDSGQIVGSSTLYHGDPTQHAFLYENGNMKDLGTLGSKILGATSNALDINNNGQIVGCADIDIPNAPDESHAFLYENGSMKDLGTLGGRNSCAQAISSDGQHIVGQSAVTGSNVNHAFLYTKGQMKDLGTLGGIYSQDSWALGVNNNSEIVGYSRATGGVAQHAFLYSDGIMLDLNALIDPDLGWNLHTAYSINESGQIIGTGTINGENHAFLMTPVSVLVPIANAGPDQTVSVNTTVQLDGNASSDPDGDYPLTYLWTVTQKPADSAAVLSDATIAIPTFNADVLGNYTIELVVTDSKGNSSLPDVVVISTTNTVPVAVIQATPMSIIQHGTTVQLDSSGSYDPDGDAITQVSWTLIPPAGSAATLVDPAGTITTFIPDVHGNYTVELIVTDKHGASSTKVSTTVTFDNIPPVINSIGYLEQGLVLVEGDTINLTSTAQDDNLDSFNYQWMIVTKPAGSAATLNDATFQNSNFVADIAGDYTVSLVVQDEHGLSSAAVTLSITVISAVDAAVDAINTIKDIFVNLDPGILKNANQQKALINKIDAVLDLIAQNELQLALDKLQNDILGKTNGCANSGYTTWDKNDWIQDCTVQKQLYTASTQQPPEAGAGIIDDAIYYLKKALGLV